MTSFSPTATTLDPPGPTDELAGAVLAGLARPILRRAPWGIVKTAILSVLTFGLAPICNWPARFRDACLREQQQLWHLAEWMRLNSGRPDAMALRESTRGLAYRAGLHIASRLVLVLGIISYFQVIPIHQRLGTLPVIFRSMYRQSSFFHSVWPIGAGSIDHNLVRFSATWGGVLTVIFVLHWLQLQLHIGDMRMFLTRFNAITSAHGLKPVRMPHTGIGLRPMWILMGVAGMAVGITWALPVMIVGAVQNRYIGRTSYIVRHELAQRMGLLVNRQNPTATVPTPMRLWSCCPNPQCGAIVPPAAKFCPRCGTTANSAV